MHKLSFPFVPEWLLLTFCLCFPNRIGSAFRSDVHARGGPGSESTVSRADCLSLASGFQLMGGCCGFKPIDCHLRRLRRDASEQA